MQYDLGYIDVEQKTLQPPFGTRVSPMFRYGPFQYTRYTFRLLAGSILCRASRRPVVGDLRRYPATSKILLPTGGAYGHDTHTGNHHTRGRPTIHRQAPSRRSDRRTHDPLVRRIHAILTRRFRDTKRLVARSSSIMRPLAATPHVRFSRRRHVQLHADRTRPVDSARTRASCRSSERASAPCPRATDDVIYPWGGGRQSPATAREPTLPAAPETQPARFRRDESAASYSSS